MASARVLITGGAGFIGSHTADALSRRGFKVRILDDLKPPVHNGKWPAYIRDKGYELIRGSASDRKTLSRALKGVSYVYHLAAYQDQREDFSTFFQVNVVSTALLYELIVAENLPVKKVIVASSQFLYGDGVYRVGSKTVFPPLRTKKQLDAGLWEVSRGHFIPFDENQPVNPTNSYGLSKMALEKTALVLGRTYQIPTTALRYSIVQGARQSPRNLYSGALRIFVLQALANKPLTVYEDGKQTRDFVNIADVVRANVLAITNKRTDYEVYNVGGGKAYRVLDFAKLVKELTRSRSKIVLGGYRRTDTRHAVSSVTKLKRLGWKPQKGPADSIREYVQWYQNEYRTSH